MTECEVIVGDNPPNRKDCDCYWFSEDITETELIAEIKELKQFYTNIRLPAAWPPHIRKGEIERL